MSLILSQLPLSVYQFLIFIFRKRLDKNIEDLDSKQDAQRDLLAKLQQQYQQAQVKAAMKAWTNPFHKFKLSLKEKRRQGYEDNLICVIISAPNTAVETNKERKRSSRSPVKYKAQEAKARLWSRISVSRSNG